MIRFLINVAISLVASALALLVCSWVLEGFTVSLTGFIMAVIVFTVAQAILSPFVFNLARQYASGLLGAISIVSTLLALWVASLFPGGLHISGLVTWVLAALITWAITALGIWLLPLLIFKKKRSRNEGAQ